MVSCAVFTDGRVRLLYGNALKQNLTIICLTIPAVTDTLGASGVSRVRELLESHPQLVSAMYEIQVTNCGARCCTNIFCLFGNL